MYAFQLALIDDQLALALVQDAVQIVVEDQLQKPGRHFGAKFNFVSIFENCRNPKFAFFQTQAYWNSIYVKMSSMNLRCSRFRRTRMTKWS